MWNQSILKLKINMKFQITIIFMHNWHVSVYWRNTKRRHCNALRYVKKGSILSLLNRAYEISSNWNNSNQKNTILKQVFVNLFVIRWHVRLDKKLCPDTHLTCQRCWTLKCFGVYTLRWLVIYYKVSKFIWQVRHLIFHELSIITRIDNTIEEKIFDHQD